MNAMKTLILAAVAVANLAAGAEAGQKKHHFFFKHHWAGGHYDHCWDHRRVAQPYYVNVRYVKHGKTYWKKVRKVRYVTKPYYKCDVHTY